MLLLSKKCNKMEKEETEKECKDKKDSIEESKQEFNKLSEKYGLPNLKNLEEDFDIEKAFEKESSYSLREIRRVIIEKTSNVLHLFENLINPSNPPMFIFTGLKSLEELDKKRIKEIYKILSKLQLEAMKNDSLYEEKSEADLVNKAFKEWEEMKHDIHKILDKFSSSLEEEKNSEGKSYFG